MKEALKMLNQMTLTVSLSAISSQELVSGQRLLETLVGVTHEKSGQVHALANLSARRAKEAGLMTSGTYGRLGSISSASIALQSSLASKLQKKKNGLVWLDLMQSDMEGLGYTVGAIVAPSAGFGGPHIRERLNFIGLADSEHARLEGREKSNRPDTACSVSDRLADSHINRRQARLQTTTPARYRNTFDADGSRHSTGPVNGFWRNADWLLCRDGKFRPVRSGTFPLAHGVAARMGRLRGYGNAFNLQQTEAFITATMELIE